MTNHDNTYREPPRDDRFREVSINAYGQAKQQARHDLYRTVIAATVVILVSVAAFVFAVRTPRESVGVQLLSANIERKHEKFEFRLLEQETALSRLQVETKRLWAEVARPGKMRENGGLSNALEQVCDSAEQVLSDETMIGCGAEPTSAFGPYVLLHENGRIAELGEKENGSNVGRRIRFLPNGQPFSMSCFIRGEEKFERRIRFVREAYAHTCE